MKLARTASAMWGKRTGGAKSVCEGLSLQKLLCLRAQISGVLHNKLFDLPQFWSSCVSQIHLTLNWTRKELLSFVFKFYALLVDCGYLATLHQLRTIMTVLQLRTVWSVLMYSLCPALHLRRLFTDQHIGMCGSVLRTQRTPDLSFHCRWRWCIFCCCLWDFRFLRQRQLR
jgi:hypothetical protein